MAAPTTRATPAWPSPYWLQISMRGAYSADCVENGALVNSPNNLEIASDCAALLDAREMLAGDAELNLPHCDVLLTHLDAEQELPRRADSISWEEFNVNPCA